MNTIDSQKCYDLNGVSLSSGRCAMDYELPQKLKKCEKMKITIC
jgi:hypothetical protein